MRLLIIATLAEDLHERPAFRPDLDLRTQAFFLKWGQLASTILSRAYLSVPYLPQHRSSPVAM